MSQIVKLNKWMKILLPLLSAIVVFFLIVLATIYTQQDKIVAEVLNTLNKDFRGRLEIKDTHISPFVNFPYVSIDIENIKVFEGKEGDSEVLLNVKDTYVGFELWPLFSGNFDIKKITLENGFLKLVQHTDGSFNITNALSAVEEEVQEPEEQEGDHIHLDLQDIQLVNIDLLKLNEANNVLVEAFINNALSRFKNSKEGIGMALDTDFEFNLIIDGDTSFLHHKLIELNTEVNFDREENAVNISPSKLLIENVLFTMKGSLDVDDDMNLDLAFSGQKPNFDLFLAFAPEELEPVFSRYENGGAIYFDATVRGKSINGFNPKVDIDFGCKEAFFHNTESDKEVNDLFFAGHFTNGEKRDPSTMSLEINDFSASPETGTFKGNLEVKNFESPDIELKLLTRFNLDFLVDFLNLENLENVSGDVDLEMNFHDIIDLSEPEKSIEKLNESYFTRLDITDLNFQSSEYPLGVKNLNLKGFMDGHQAEIRQLDFMLGSSDVSIEAKISDLPAIIHHTDLPVFAEMNIQSSLLNLTEITGNAKDSTVGMKEQIQDLSMTFSFKSSARAFTESPNLPLGEFFIDKLSAGFKNYPHKIHDFHADVIIDTTDFRVIDFSGMIDESDFHFDGNLKNYDLWFEEVPKGLTEIDFQLNADYLKLEDLFTYGGENYVPEDYRHEELRNLKLHGLAKLAFEKKLQSAEIAIDHFGANMKVHSMRFENFKGVVALDSVRMEISDFGGELGNSNFSTDLLYYFVDDSIGNFSEFKIQSDHLDFDQIFAYNPPPENKTTTSEDHENAFNIFELPFKNMNFDLDIKKLNYHRYLLDDFILKGRMQEDHYIFVDTMALKASGGEVSMNGYFNGSNPELIYFSPNMKLKDVDLDQLLFKFENFGQDHLVSENLHGMLSGNLSGKIHVYPDLVPIIDDSELQIDLEVLNGSINNYAPFEALSEYFTDKNLSNIRFDTLSNTLEMTKGVLTIPAMTINSTIGYFEVSGSQSTDLQMEYYMRIPVNLVAQAGIKKLFGKNEKADPNQVDSIQYRDPTKRTSFFNIKLEGTPDDYKISLKKDKE